MVGCCVVGCHESTQKGAKVFRVPWDAERKLRWAVAINRKYKDGKLWMPNAGSRVCSAHFVTGERSDDPEHVDYVPSLFSYDTRKTKRAKKAAAKHDSYLGLCAKRAGRHTSPTARASQQMEDSDADHMEPEDEGDTVSFPGLHDAGMQTDPVLYLCTNCHSIYQDEILKQQAEGLQHENAQLRQKLSTARDIHLMEDSKLQFYSGLPKLLFLAVLTTVVAVLPPPRVTFPYPCQLLMFLMKLRLNLYFKDLAYRFDVTEKTARKVFKLWLGHMKCMLQELVVFPTPDLARSWLQAKERLHFPRLRCIIDCTEVFLSRPTNQETQQQAWCMYKQHCTLKYLVAVNPHGAVCFVSRAYGGRISDKQIVLKSGFLDFLQKGDQVLADRGFLLHDEFLVRDLQLIMPSFLHCRQLPRDRVCQSRRVSSSRIIVERAIGSIKKWKIMTDTVPYFLRKEYSDILVVVAGLTNLTPSLIAS